MKVWIWYRCQNRIGKHYHHDGEQLNAQGEQNEGYSCNFCIARKNFNLFNNKESCWLYVSATKLHENYLGNRKMLNVSLFEQDINMLPCSVVFIKKMNLM